MYYLWLFYDMTFIELVALPLSYLFRQAMGHILLRPSICLGKVKLWWKCLLALQGENSYTYDYYWEKLKATFDIKSIALCFQRAHGRCNYT